MADKIKVFISYKKQLGGVENAHANLVYSHLVPEFDPWFDTVGNGPGESWLRGIHDQLVNSDVLLVLIGPGTSQSEWVKREIDLARALRLGILPIGFSISPEAMTEEVKGLEISDIQYAIAANIHDRDVFLAQVRERIRTLASRAREDQKPIMTKWGERLRSVVRAPDRQVVESFDLGPSYHDLKLHVSSGDIAKVVGIDVIVNSENNHMLMARPFESASVSATLRSRGYWWDDKEKYYDTVQDELNRHLREMGRPVKYATVIATSAGHPKSKLATVNRARVLLHVAAVEVVESEMRVSPYRTAQHIEDCVWNALKKMVDLNRRDGVFSPEDTPQYEAQVALAKAGRGKLQSVIFPLFGTGTGGARAADVVTPMIDGLMSFLEHPEYREDVKEIRHIYFSAFAADDVPVLLNAMRDRFGRGRPAAL